MHIEFPIRLPDDIYGKRVSILSRIGCLWGRNQAKLIAKMTLAKGGWSCLEMVLRCVHLGGERLKKAAARISVTNW